MTSFRSLEELRHIADIIGQGDFDRADVRCDSESGLLTLRTSRPLQEALKGGGLFRTSRLQWVSCRLAIRHVRELRIWEEEDLPPPSGTLEIEPAEGLFRIRLASARGLRIQATVSALEGELEDGG